MITPALTLVCLGIRGCCQIHGEMSVAIRSSQQVMDKSCKPFVFKKTYTEKEDRCGYAGVFKNSYRHKVFICDMLTFRYFGVFR